MGLFFEIWEVSDPAKVEEHDKLCEEWILEYVHTLLGESLIPHRLYSQDENPTVKAMSVEYSTKAEMDKVMKALFSDDKFKEYYEKWKKYLDKPHKRYFFDELSPEVMKQSYMKAKGIK
ncbi:MAG: hypothetical protein ACXAEX_20165 [Promethearchaeota archaeon]|jgi:hypothetical protein